ncbi:MAG: aldo/keto reductase [Actinomycetota bacterium]
MSIAFATDRYDHMQYRRSGRSGLELPAISLGAWKTFGDNKDLDVARACMHAAFDLGITHFDLANNYGDPPGNAEVIVGGIVGSMPRDELVISSKAGYRMWPGPYGEWGSRKSLIASCDQSLKRTGLDYFDIFYSHRPDPRTPIEETLGALDTLVRQGKALYAGVSSYTGAQFAAAVRVCEREGLTRITVHQPLYNLLHRTVEWDLLPQTEAAGTGVVAFCPLASGLLTGKFLDGNVPAGARAAGDWTWAWVEKTKPADRARILTGLNSIAAERAQSLAQMALSWTLRHSGVTSALIGASRPEQVVENVAALQNLDFTTDELDRIDALTATTATS